jgi:uncharacterized hydrophobic protein (TIGR00271 family)
MRVKRLLTAAGTLMHGGPVGPEDLAQLEGKLYFDLDGTRDPYVRFAVLLVLSVVIATGGVLTDSTATVIGAMIVAPLMTPIMASGLAIVTGDARRLRRSLLVVGLAVLAAVGISLAIGWLAIGIPDPNTNSQMVGRTSPRTTDLLVALASGAAGAFALSRRSVADALPGVAIAVSLVPPLCVVGVSLSVGDLDAASGAFLLFATNFLAIVAAGGGLMALMGYGAVARRAVDADARRRAALVTGLALAAISVPLVATTIRVAQDSLLEREARTVVQRWLAGSAYRFVQATADRGEVVITVTGSGTLPTTADLGARVAALREGAHLVLIVVPSQRYEESAGQ